MWVGVLWLRCCVCIMQCHLQSSASTFNHCQNSATDSSPRWVFVVRTLSTFLLTRVVLLGHYIHPFSDIISQYAIFHFWKFATSLSPLKRWCTDWRCQGIWEQNIDPAGATHVHDPPDSAHTISPPYQYDTGLSPLFNAVRQRLYQIGIAQR